LAAWFSGPALAQSAPASPGANAGTEEIVVTAERRTEDIQRTPLAVTALSAQTLDKSFVTQIADLNSTVPSFQSTKTSGFENIVTIRGIGSETPENDLTTVPGTSLFVDGVYMVNTISLSQTLFDLDRIEVLRGPQGALYGQSSIGGAINIVTRQPELDQFSGFGDFSVGTYALTRERAEVNVPIGDELAVRGSIQRFDHKGFTNDVSIPGFREDDAHNTGIKAAVLWQPVSDFSATLTGQWYKADENGQAQQNINDPSNDPWQIHQDYPSKSNLDTALYHLNLQYDAPWFSLRSVSGYQYLNSILQEDSDRSTFALLGAYDHVAGWNTWVRSYTEEFDILSSPDSPLQWIVGGFLLRQDSRQFVAEFEGFTPPPDHFDLRGIENPPYPLNLAYGNVSNVTRNSDSVFAQATYSILPNWRITAGGRLNYDRYVDNLFNFSAFGSAHPPPNRKSDSVPTWRLETDYDLTPDNMLYASFTRGYKPGGVNGNPGAFVVPFQFEPETNTAFEAGSKNFLLNHTLRLNLAGFLYHYKNMQYIETDPVPFAAGISNIPSVHIYGVEAEATYISPDDRLRFDGVLALENGSVQGDYFTIDSTVQNAIYASDPNCAGFLKFFVQQCWIDVAAAAKNIRGKMPPAMPKVSGSFDVSYMFDIPWGSLTPRLEYIYRGKEWARIFNQPGLDSMPAYSVVNLNLSFVPRDAKWQAAVTATNIFNKAGVNSRYTDPYGTGQTSQQYISPRQVIFSIAYAF
jgi:iron complex outermembrane receptor protein